jgi:subtilisin family serine protease
MNIEGRNSVFCKKIVVFITCLVIAVCHPVYYLSASGTNTIYNEVLDNFSAIGYDGTIKIVMNSDKRNGLVDGEVIIIYKDSRTMKKESPGINRRYSLSIKKEIELVKAQLVKLPHNVSVEQAIENIKKDKHVADVQPNFLYYHQSVNEYNFDTEPWNRELWGLRNAGQVVANKQGLSGIDINLINAWSVTQGKEDIIVAVLDTGININHPDLRDSIWINSGEIPGNGMDDDGNGYVDDINGWDFFRNDNSVYDRWDGENHGTHIAGTIAAALNGYGISGVAPAVRVMPLKFMGPDGTGTTASVLKAIEYAKVKGAKIINASWGGPGLDPILRSAIESSGMLFVAAAGNDGNNNDTAPIYPAAFDLPNVITVAAVDSMGNLAGFSNYGANTVHVAAPGDMILSTVPNGYAYMSGTSMAAPHVAGTAALMMSSGITDPAVIKERLIRTARPLDSLMGKVLSGGMIDTYEALGGQNWKFDLNRNGIIDIADIAILAQRINSTPEDAGWNPFYDINEDGIIDIYDMVQVSRRIN